MGFSKNDFEKVDLRIKKITEQTVEQIEVDSELPPTIEQLEDNNKTYSIMAAILFIDIRKSTYLTENSQAKSMVKIYRSFMRMAVDCFIYCTIHHTPVFINGVNKDAHNSVTQKLSCNSGRYVWTGKR